MVSVTVFRPLPNDSIDCLAVATVLRGKLSVEGPRPELVDTSRPMFSVRRGSLVEFNDDHEEWLRSFPDSFRSAQVVAAIVKDTQHKELEAAPEVIERLDAAQHLAAR